MKGIPQRVSSILIIKLSSLGDVLLGTVVLPTLAAHWPEAVIDWVVEPAGEALLANNPYLRQRIIFPRREIARLLLRHPFRALKLLRSFRQAVGKKQYDLVIDLQGLAKSWIVMLLADTHHHALRVGKGRFPFVDIKCPHQRAFRRHAVPSYFEPLSKIMSLPPVISEVLPIFIPDKLAHEQRAKLWQGEQSLARYVVFHPWTTWPTKHWPSDLWKRLAILCSQNAFAIVITGAEAEREKSIHLAQDIKCEAGSARVLVAAGRLGFGGFAVLAKDAYAVISVDSLPMHLAAAAGARVISLHGPTDPVRTGPWGRGCLAVTLVGVMHSTTQVVGMVDSTTQVVGVMHSTTQVVGMVDSTTQVVGVMDSTTQVVGVMDSTTQVVGVMHTERCEDSFSIVKTPPPWPVQGLACGKLPCLKRNCPGYQMACMRMLSPDTVMDCIMARVQQKISP
jgi:ADP-heptose:LPS heptosyltransferase